MDPNQSPKPEGGGPRLRTRTSLEHIYQLDCRERSRTCIEPLELATETEARLEFLIDALLDFKSKYNIEMLAASQDEQGEDREVLLRVTDQETGKSVYPSADFTEGNSLCDGLDCGWVILLDRDIEQRVNQHDGIFGGCLLRRTSLRAELEAFSALNTPNFIHTEVERDLGNNIQEEFTIVDFRRAATLSEDRYGFMIIDSDDHRFVGEILFPQASQIVKLEFLWEYSPGEALARTKTDYTPASKNLVSGFCEMIQSAGGTVIPEEEHPDFRIDLLGLSNQYLSWGGIDWKKRRWSCECQALTTVPEREGPSRYMLLTLRDRVGNCIIPGFCGDHFVKDSKSAGLIAGKADIASSEIEIYGYFLSGKKLRDELEYATEKPCDSVLTAGLLRAVGIDLMARHVMPVDGLLELYRSSWILHSRDSEYNLSTYSMLIEHTYGAHLLLIKHHEPTGALFLDERGITAVHYYQGDVLPSLPEQPQK